MLRAYLQYALSGFQATGEVTGREKNIRGNRRAAELLQTHFEDEETDVEILKTAPTSEHSPGYS